MSKCAAAKPYVLPESLAELGGPTAGGVTLPRHIGWGPHYVYDLADEADFRLMYERVIREAQTRDGLNAYLHATSLRQVWHDLFLPLPVRAAWETRFPDLRESSTATAAAQWTSCTAN
ncbi:hypothetical protein [Streptomyces sp. NPDC059455]|uniref:hypothetical protein n=1 Tax=Streptomyces sp. NPDC059455 TaxID=3346837 RepID=UPI003695DD12